MGSSAKAYLKSNLSYSRFEGLVFVHIVQTTCHLNLQSIKTNLNVLCGTVCVRHTVSGSGMPEKQGGSWMDGIISSDRTMKGFPASTLIAQCQPARLTGQLRSQSASFSNHLSGRVTARLALLNVS